MKSCHYNKFHSCLFEISLKHVKLSERCTIMRDIKFIFVLNHNTIGKKCGISVVFSANENFFMNSKYSKNEERKQMCIFLYTSKNILIASFCLTRNQLNVIKIVASFAVSSISFRLLKSPFVAWGGSHSRFLS